MTIKVKDLRKLPFRKVDKPSVYERLLVISSGKKHDSGYALMYIIGENNNKMEIAASCDDIQWYTGLKEFQDLRTDMLYPSGIIRFWSNSFNFKVGPTFNSVDVTLVEKD